MCLIMMERSSRYRIIMTDTITLMTPAMTAARASMRPMVRITTTKVRGSHMVRFADNLLRDPKWKST